MKLENPRLQGLVCLFLGLQLATAQSFRLANRQDEPTPETTAIETDASPTTVQETLTESTGRPGPTETDIETTISTETDSPSRTTESSPEPTNISTDGPLDESAFRNETIPEGQLPLKPELSPGWGVAGATLMTSGLAYTFIGIRHRAVNTFFSSAFLAALAIAVLIIYVMKIPVSDGMQGGYVAAVILSGCALGAASTFFKELTEGLGCALGGFCLSMWLLCLSPGGLLEPVASKAIFIACFTLVGFVFYFSHWTRDWALIILISFGGGMITVLGIDCFSRAGLKEFWAYIWDLNGDLFPFGTNTYPVTKAIRVETAAVVILALFGVISQMKLWRVVREKREKRAAARDEERKQQVQEDDDQARKVEEATARDRRDWERVHGDGEAGCSTGSRGSPDHGMSEKHLVAAEIAGADKKASVEVIEMSPVSSSRNLAQPDPLMATENDLDGKVMVRVAADDHIGPAPLTLSVSERPTSYVSSNGGPRSSIGSRPVSGAIVSPPPAVVPLPFTVPPEEDSGSIGSRSSRATFADDEEAKDEPSHRSFVKRLSQNSATLLRSMSPRLPVSPSFPHGDHGESSDELVTPELQQQGDNRSVAATLDGESLSASERGSIDARSIEINAQLSKNEDTAEEKPSSTVGELPTLPDQPRGSALTVSTDILGITPGDQKSVAEEPAKSQGGDAPEPSEKPKSVLSVSSTPVSLTKEKLPRSLSRVALSYRTNEWAKHLSQADAPEPEQLHVIETTQKGASAEVPAPVLVDDLQQTAEDSARSPTSTPRRQDSLGSQGYATRSSSRLDAEPPTPLSPQEINLPKRQHSTGSQNGIPRSSPSSALRRSSATFQPIAEEHVVTAEPIQEGELESSSLSMAQSSQVSPSSSGTPGVVSYASPQTLLGQRDMFLRNKSQGNLLSPMPEPPGISSPSSDAGSVYAYSTYAPSATGDMDDVPLSQRKHLMRQSSMMSLGPGLAQRHSTMDLHGDTAFNSHQPQRVSTLPTPAAREAQLAQFRQSVALDVRSGTPMLTSSGRETPFASTYNLLSGREMEVQRGIDIQRSRMMGQKEAEGQRREMARQQQEWNNRVFDERMRNGDLMEAHREAMRKMQKSAK